MRKTYIFLIRAEIEINNKKVLKQFVCNRNSDYVEFLNFYKDKNAKFFEIDELSHMVFNNNNEIQILETLDFPNYFNRDQDEINVRKKYWIKEKNAIDENEEIVNCNLKLSESINCYRRKLQGIFNYYNNIYKNNKTNYKAIIFLYNNLYDKIVNTKRRQLSFNEDELKDIDKETALALSYFLKDNFIVLKSFYDKLDESLINNIDIHSESKELKYQLNKIERKKEIENFEKIEKLPFYIRESFFKIGLYLYQRIYGIREIEEDNDSFIYCLEKIIPKQYHDDFEELVGTTFWSPSEINLERHIKKQYHEMYKEALKLSNIDNYENLAEIIRELY